MLYCPSSSVPLALAALERTREKIRESSSSLQPSARLALDPWWRHVEVDVSSAQDDAHRALDAQLAELAAASERKGDSAARLDDRLEALPQEALRVDDFLQRAGPEAGVSLQLVVGRARPGRRGPSERVGLASSLTVRTFSTYCCTTGQLCEPTGVKRPSAIVLGVNSVMRRPAASPRTQSSAPSGSAGKAHCQCTVEKLAEA